MIDQTDYTVCITGTSRGLGYALVEAFLKKTQFQIAAITGNGAVLNSKLEGITGRERVRIIEASISEFEGRGEIKRQISGMPPLKIVIHNAGKLLLKPFLEISEAELAAVYKVNVFAPFHLTQVLMPFMEGCHTIHISSVGGVEGSLKFAGLSAYSTSKAALNCLTEMLSEEFKATDHVFNCLAMGSVATEMFRKAFPGASASATPEQMAAYIVGYAIEAPKVMRGKIISLSVSNP